ncbi:uncharacterized protein LOC143295171 [Babylonia areolata]|uniref:uncharacterized protein LOC143295171 n=1 Tax=Babylonia areolata TaxID=304850 RepID=UPI003FD4A28C
MEWERKFYDIVRETESNLASARRKLHGLDTSKHPSPQPESIQKTVPTYQSPGPMSFVNNNDHINWIRREMGWSVPSASSTAGPEVVASTSLFSPFSNELRELRTKMDSQSQVIESLEQLVRTMNQEKDRYRRQIQDLQNEVSTLSSRLQEREGGGGGGGSGGGGGVDSHLQTQVEQVRQEMRSDLQRLQSAITAAATSVAHSKPGGAQYADSLERSFQDMQKSVHSELEELRRDLNSMIRRVGRLELDVSTHSTGQGHRDLPSTLGQSEGSRGAAGRMEHSRAVPGKQSQPLTPGDLFQVKELRNTVSQLHDKLDSLEGRVAASSKSSSPLISSLHVSSFATGKPSTSFRSKVTFEDFLDDDDNDDDDSDLDDLGLTNEFDLDLPVDNEALSDDLEEIVGVKSKAPRSSAAKSSELHAVFDDDDDDDDDVGDVFDGVLDDLRLGSTTGVEGSKASGGSSTGRTQRQRRREKKEGGVADSQQLSSHSSSFSGWEPGTKVSTVMDADPLSNLHLDHLDLDSPSDPYDLDSLDDEESGLLNGEDL